MRGNWDTIAPAPGPRKPITEGIKVGTIRTRHEGKFLTCGHRNVAMEEDQTGKFFRCGLGHRDYIVHGEEHGLWAEVGFAFETEAEAVEHMKSYLPEWFHDKAEIVKREKWGWYLPGESYAVRDAQPV